MLNNRNVASQKKSKISLVWDTAWKLIRGIPHQTVHNSSTANISFSEPYVPKNTWPSPKWCKVHFSGFPPQHSNYASIVLPSLIFSSECIHTKIWLILISTWHSTGYFLLQVTKSCPQLLFCQQKMFQWAIQEYLPWIQDCSPANMLTFLEIKLQEEISAAEWWKGFVQSLHTASLSLGRMPWGWLLLFKY